MTTDRIYVLGVIWMPAVPCAQEIMLSAYDIENMRDANTDAITRDDVEQWLSMHAGDFQSITDFYAVIDDTTFEWSDPDSETFYYHLLTGDE